MRTRPTRHRERNESTVRTHLSDGQRSPAVSALEWTTSYTGVRLACRRSDTLVPGLAAAYFLFRIGGPDETS